MHVNMPKNKLLICGYLNCNDDVEIVGPSLQNSQGFDISKSFLEQFLQFKVGQYFIIQDDM